MQITATIVPEKVSRIAGRSAVRRPQVHASVTTTQRGVPDEDPRCHRRVRERGPGRPDGGRCVRSWGQLLSDPLSPRSKALTPLSLHRSIGGSSPTTITLGSQLPTITDPAGLTIDGASANITISGSFRVRVFQVPRGAKLTLNSLTVDGGFINASAIPTGDVGGGIYNAGTLTVNNSAFSANLGGGVANVF